MPEVRFFWSSTDLTLFLSPISPSAIPSPTPPKFVPHWKRGLPEPTPHLNHPSQSSSRSGPYMERRSTVSGPTAPANAFPPPLPATSYPSTRSVSPDRMGSSVSDRTQAFIHRAQTQTSSGRRPLPAIGTRSPPVPPLPGLCYPNNTHRVFIHGLFFSQVVHIVRTYKVVLACHPFQVRSLN